MTDWQKGLQAFREGRMREAADRLGRAAAENELKVAQEVRFETCAHLGAALYAEGKPAEAVMAFETAFRLAPTSIPPPGLSLNLVHAYLAAGRRGAAREALLFLLHHTPGHVAARMLLQRLDDTRLDNTPDDEVVTGSIMGATVESVKQYVRTLVFATVEVQGYDPIQVREAFHQLEHYLDGLDKQMQSGRQQIQRLEAEIERYRLMEETMVQNLVQMQQQSENKSAETNSQLSPIEILFQTKP